MKLNANLVGFAAEYADVRFHSQNVKLWLPQSAAVFFDYGDARVMVQHTFSDFHVFLVQTGEVGGKPKESTPAPQPPVTKPVR